MMEFNSSTEISSQFDHTFEQISKFRKCSVHLDILVKSVRATKTLYNLSFLKYAPFYTINTVR